MNQQLHYFENAQKVSYLVQKALEFINHKTEFYLQQDPRREQMRTEAVFLRDMRTVSLGFGRAASIMLYISKMVGDDGLVIVGGTDTRNGAFNESIVAMSDGTRRLIDKISLPHTYFPSRISRVILLHEQRGLDLEEFFSWVAEQPHNEEIEIIIFTL
jgi:hypothetical protein